jgi:inosose dehydratase
MRSRAAHDIAQETAGFCLDTGHTFCAGTDPTETLVKYADRLDYIHFTEHRLREVQRDHGPPHPLLRALRRRRDVPDRRGCIDYPAIRKLLTRSGYAGFLRSSRSETQYRRQRCRCEGEPRLFAQRRFLTLRRK